MARKTGLVWVLWGGLALGLLLVSGCQEGVAGRAETVAETEPAEPSADETVGGAEELEDEAAVPEEAGPPVALALRFTPGEAAIYKVTTEATKSVAWAGSASSRPAQFRGGRTSNRVETTFEQRVESVGSDGDATLAITITALRYTARVRDNAVLDFDSAAEGGQGSPLAALVGQSYKIQMSGKGEVLSVVDAAGAREAVQGSSAAHRTAGKLLSDAEIKDRHTVAALAALKTTDVRSQQQWSSVKTFDFGMMGAKAYERIYTLGEVVESDGRSVAVVEMNAIPSAAMAEEMHERQTTSMFAAMFDNTESYTGRARLDLGSGQLLECSEQLESEWVVADPAAAEGDVEPAALKMTATHLYRLERVK